MLILEEELTYANGFKAGVSAGKDIGYEEGFRDGLNDLVDKELEIESKIYRVFGQTGEYSDAHEWTVKSFRTKQKAYSFIVELIKYFVAKGFKNNDGNLEGDYTSGYNPDLLDPGFSCDYAGTKYGIEEILLC